MPFFCNLIINASDIINIQIISVSSFKKCLITVKVSSFNCQVAESSFVVAKTCLQFANVLHLLKSLPDNVDLILISGVCIIELSDETELSGNILKESVRTLTSQLTLTDKLTDRSTDRLRRNKLKQVVKFLDREVRSID